MNFKKYFFIIITGIFHSAVYFSFGNSTIYPADSQSVIPTHLNGSQRVGPGDSNNGQIVRPTHSDMPAEIITTEQLEQRRNEPYYEPDSQSVIPTHVNGSQRVVPGDSNNGQILRLTHSNIPAEIITITPLEERRRNAEAERKLIQFLEQYPVPHYYLPKKRKIDECPECVICSSVLCCWWPCLLYWGMEPSEK